MKVGLYFGSFNPIHIGHLAIANYIVEYTEIEKLWFVISPHNPLKKKNTLLNDYDRFELVYRSIKDDARFEASDIEFRMPKPSYTIDTLAYLDEKQSGNEYCLIMGSDGLTTFNKWKNAEEIVKRYHRYVYPRPGTPKEEYNNHKNITVVDAPLMEISSSFIRAALAEGKDVQYFIPREAYQYIMQKGFYQ
ncbi:MAG: nicotinate (nicotinamide) nucleotide adenylyltransferase [Bacteroidota bacterium]